MEILSEIKPELFKKVLPTALQKAMTHIFQQGISDTALVGGTALSGFYAGHRKSDDLDLFTKNELSFKHTVLAVKSLETKGAKFEEESTSSHYYHALVEWLDHHFTIDVVVDENLFRVGRFIPAHKTILVADLKTLFAMKMASLVSRSSEKDLYDLLWFFQNKFEFSMKELIEMGKSIDGGVNAENILSCLLVTRLQERACGFGINKQENVQKIYKRIIKFQKELIREVKKYMIEEKKNKMGEIIKLTKKIKK